MSGMTEAQAKAIVREMTGYSVDDSPGLALDMAERLGRGLIEAVSTLGGVPPITPLESQGVRLST
jgi:hypothetical protein